MPGSDRILVIKLSALGDFVQAMGPFQAIRRHHPDARITLLTTKPYVALAQACPWFDEVWTDARPKMWDAPGIFRLRRLLRSKKFDMVYDLQTSDRSNWYYQLLGKPKWSGIAPGASHYQTNPDRDLMHTVDRQADQLAAAGIPEVPPPDLSWVKADVRRFALKQPYALLAPGGAAHRPDKRWPAERFAKLAEKLAARGTQPVLVGGTEDLDAIHAILETGVKARSLAGKTSLEDLIALGRDASLAVGNDTGPMHLFAAAGCACVVLFSADSDPALCAPHGKVTILRRDELADLPMAEVESALPN